MSTHTLTAEITDHFERYKTAAVTILLKPLDAFKKAEELVNRGEVLPAHLRKQWLTDLQAESARTMQPCRDFIADEIKIAKSRTETNFPYSCLYSFWINHSLVAEITRDTAFRLAEREDVEFIHLIGRTHFEIASTRNCSAHSREQRVRDVHHDLEIPELWSQQSDGLQGQGMSIVHVGTGVNSRHPDLKDKVERCVKISPTDGRATDIVPPQNAEDTDTMSFHGTMTSSLLVGGDGKENIIGVAPKAKLYVAIITNGQDERTEQARLARFRGGLQWAALQGAKVLSMSQGLRPAENYERDFRRTLDVLILNDTLPVAAIGNQDKQPSAPAFNEECLAVGALDTNSVGPMPGTAGGVLEINDPSAFYQNHQAKPTKPQFKPDVMAPGEDIYTCFDKDSYSLGTGTSMATPLVAGVATLLRQAVPQATPQQIRKALETSAKDLGPQKGDDPLYGHGKIRPMRALEMLREM